MIKLAYIGGGGHSRGNHLPAIQHFQSQHPNQVELCAFCDIDPTVAQQTASEFGFAHHFTDLTAMLDSQRFDACIAITPVGATAEVAMTVMKRGIPLLMEKPLGATLEQSRAVCDLADQLHSKVMVSLNRRFDPAIIAACGWIVDRPLQHIHVRMLRNNRREPTFISETGIHCIDATRHIAGDFQTYNVKIKQVDGIRWYHITVEFVNGTTGVIDIFPTCGSQSERYELYGSNYHALTRVAEFDAGTFIVHDQGKSFSPGNLPPLISPMFIRNGAYAETVSFFSACRAGSGFFPTPGQVWPSQQVCYAIAQLAG